ncbi:MAG TPA: type I restriction endonuclease, partial [Candidatus Cryosericum sp.]|nr:type I restriction endonuclease [Candidatus Cryosericum sp.]
MILAESVVEDACLSWAEGIGFQVVAGPSIAPGELAAERTSYDQVILEDRLRSALRRLNPSIPADCLDDVVRRLERQEVPSLVQSNRLFHRWLVSGFPVEYQGPDGSIKGDLVHLVDFDHPEANDWLAVNQFTVVENNINRRADVVLFVNGLPLVVMELKNPADENTTIWTAFNQLQTYKKQIPNLMRFNEALVISDGTEARIGSLTADKERFMRWRTIEGDQLAPASMPQLDVLIKGALGKRRFLDIVRSFVVFEDGDGDPIKIMAA